MRCVFKSTIAALAVTGLMFAASVPALAQSGTRSDPPSGSSDRTSSPEGSGKRTSQEAPLALEGYCPVSLEMMNKWVEGVPSISTVFDGHTYYFANEEGKEMFVADPAKYVPVLGGDCAVSLVKMGKRVPGDIRQAALHQGRLFLFANEEGKEMFLADPKTYANADLALGGRCAVCRVDEKGLAVEGKPEFTVIHKGLRYWFPSEEKRKKFLADPGKYEVSATSDQPSMGGSGSRKPGGSGSGSR